MDNNTLFNSISTWKDIELVIDLDNYQESLDSFRKATSKIRTLNSIDYRVVYLEKKDFAGLTIKYDQGKELKLIINLQYYYVYGFLLNDGKVYAYTDDNPQDDCYKALTDLGFSCKKIPYGDAYYDISDPIGYDIFNKLKQTKVSHQLLINALNELADANIPFYKKNESILIVFWSLIEGIRFAGISNIVSDLIQGQHPDFIYDYFYELAEIWAKLSLITAYEKTLNPDIAVYDLNRIS